MDFITQFLARVFEQFKVRNPKAALAIQLALGVVVYTANQGTLLGAFSLPEWAAGAVQFIGVFLMAVTGSETFRFLPAHLQAKRKASSPLESDNRTRI